MYKAEVLADSINAHGNRLTTLVVTFPRFILAEFNTHRMLSRNSASSRAIPVKKRIAAVRLDPFIPEVFGKNAPGMQSREALDETDQALAKSAWVLSMKWALEAAEAMSNIGVHKQYANRLLEPFSWHTVIVSATEWDNFFHLRDHPDATPEFEKIAHMMRVVMAASTPQLRQPNEWHLPYITDEDHNQTEDCFMLAQISSARCARVSYLTHDGKRDIDADLSLAKRLLDAGHMSPFEHPASARYWPGSVGNFYGWMQYRKRIAAEDDRLGPRGLNTALIDFDG